MVGDVEIARTLDCGDAGSSGILYHSCGTWSGIVFDPRCVRVILHKFHNFDVVVSS
jgi:hypothetical protein